MIPCKIRPATVADLPALVEIERACFPDPWGEGALRGQLEAATGLSLVAETAKGVAGYLLLAVLPPEGEVYRVAVRPTARRCGIADALLTDGLARLAAAGVTRLFLDVRAGNDPARALYEKHGFLAVGRRKGYYRAPTEDAILMEREDGTCSI